MEQKELNVAQTAQVNQLVQPLNVICKSFTRVRTKFYLCNPFTRNRTNSVTADCSIVSIRELFAF